mgnify:CR=1 FL=1
MFKGILKLGFEILLERVEINEIEGEDIEKWNRCIKYLEIEYRNTSDLLIKDS